MIYVPLRISPVPPSLRLATAGLVTLLVACGGGSGSSSGTSEALCGAGRSGITQCAGGGLRCAAGQFCLDDFQCSPGCTSDANCFEGDRCVRESGEAVGSCQPCAPSMPPVATDAGTTTSLARCRMALGRAFECELIDNAELAQGEAACATLSSAQQEAFARCVETASSCDDVERCLGGGEDPESCSVDEECNTEPGVEHEICSGGSCVEGCRTDEDCGNDFVCETSIRQCMPSF